MLTPILPPSSSGGGNPELEQRIAELENEVQQLEAEIETIQEPLTASSTNLASFGLASGADE
ncbi:hypothetical protein [Pseudochrobactrum asaccharolyticum]|uniref:hypothetical protein n=1 Tax=Pseudochrobactrum asaccharolyticum TaxID=354351 RepID=UPI004041B3EE